jgi:hypothetical protein
MSLISEPEGLAEGAGCASPRRVFPGRTKKWGLGQVFMLAEAQNSSSVTWILWPLTAVGLILSVFTVILLVTRPAHGDAAPTGAGEVIEGASGALHT